MVLHHTMYLSNDVLIWQQSIPQIEVSNMPYAFKGMCHLLNSFRHNPLQSVRQCCKQYKLDIALLKVRMPFKQ